MTQEKDIEMFEHLESAVPHVSLHREHYHFAPKTVGDNIAKVIVHLSALTATILFQKRYGHRAIVLETIASVLAVKNDIVPPTINHFTDDPQFDPKLNFTFNKAQKRIVRAALSNTFGFGGHNASVIVKKY